MYKSELKKIKIPETIKRVIDILENHSHKAYLVGGCVRDSLLGIDPHDYDITTDAVPEEVEEAFSGYNVIETGIKHGTVTVLIDKEPIEITTFRTEDGYSDHRHPDKVEFTADISEDLSRRDFTVNAIAYSPSAGYCDPFGGCDDLKKNILKCVGNPDERFNEDPLRILRAIRFSAVYGFDIDPVTEESMHSNRQLISELSAERIRKEIEQILLSQGVYNALMRYSDIFAVPIPELKPMVGFDQRSRYHIYDVYEHTAKAVEAIDARPELRWAALLHDVAKPLCFSEDEKGGHFYGHEKKSAEMAREIFNRLKFDNFTKDEACFVIEKHMVQIEPSEKGVKRRLRQFDETRVRNLLQMLRADLDAQNPELYSERKDKYDEIEQLIEKIVEEESCFSIKDLAINGNDLLRLGVEGPKIGKILNILLDDVVEGRIENKRSALLSSVASMINQKDAN